MNRNIITPTLVLASCLVTAYVTAQNVKLSGKIIAPNSDSVFLQYSAQSERGWEAIVLASDALNEKGEFRLEATLDSAMSLMLYDGLEMASLVLVPGDDMQMSLHTAFFDETLSFVGIGAERNNALANLVIVSEVVAGTMAELNEKTDTVALFKKIDEGTKRVLVTIADYGTLFPELTSTLEGMKRQTEFSASNQKKNVTRKMKFNRLRESLEGKNMIDIVGVDMEGETMPLSGFKGKTTVIDFWATWCGPCKAEMPHLKALEDKYGNEVNFVSIGTFCKEEDWKKMAAELGFRHNMYISKDNATQIEPYMVNAIPRYMVIDKDLKIVSIDAPRPSSGELEKLF